MDFDTAIRAHTNWKMTLTRYLRKPDRSLRAVEVSRDDTCELGCWLHGEGRRLGHLPEFQTLKAAHREFHHAAGDLVRRADAGESLSAATALGSASPYDKASSGVTMALMAMKRKSAA